MLILLSALLLPTPSQSTAPSGSQPSLACFERLADAEGELELAENPVWRKKALGELARMRARTGEYYAEVDVDLAENRRSRDALQAEFDSGAMAEDDFNAARSELEMKARELTQDRERAGIPECGI